MRIINVGREFSLSGDEAPLGIAVTLAVRQYSGNDPRRISPLKITLWFGAKISAIIFRNRGNTPKGSTPPYVSRSRSRRRRTGVRKAKELRLALGKQDKGVNCSRHCLLPNWESRSHAFSAGATTKPSPSPLRAGKDGFTLKIEPWSVSYQLCEQVECFRVFLVRLLCDSLVAPHTLRASARASTNWTQLSALRALHQARWAVCLASYALRQLTSNHCFSPDLLRKTVVGTRLTMTSVMVRSDASNGSADLKMVLHCIEVLTAQRILPQLVWCLRMRVLLALYSGTDCSTWSIQLTKQWSEVPSGVPTNTSAMSGASVITRSSLLPAMWVGQQTNCSQRDRLQKSKASRPCRSVGKTDSYHSEWWAFASPTKTKTALSSTDCTRAIESRRQS